MKKLTIVLIMVLTVVTAIFAQSEADFKVEINETGDGAIITKYLGKATQVRIPATIQGVPVKELKQYSFCRTKENLTEITSIIIPEGVIKIGEQAFGRIVGASQQILSPQQKLMSVRLPNTLTYIGDSAFSLCQALVSINLENVTFIGPGAFSGTGIKSVTLSSKLTRINGDTFSNTKLESITIPEGTTEISSTVFKNCSLLKTVILPSTIKKIGFESFFKCTSLTNVTIPDTVQKIEFWEGCFGGCSNLPLSVQADLRKRGYTGSF